MILTSNPRSPASPSSISWGRYVLPSNEVVGPRKPWTNSLRRVVLKAEPDVAVSRPSNVVGFTIGCSINGLQFDSGLLDPNYAVLDALGAALFRHPVGQTAAAFLKDHNLAWSGRHLRKDDYRTAPGLRRRTATVPTNEGDRPPPRWDVAVPGRPTHSIGRRRHDRGLRAFYYDTVSGSLDVLNCTRHAFGTDRLLFGTDNQICDAREFERHLTYLGDATMSEDELDAVRRRRAGELMGIG